MNHPIPLLWLLLNFKMFLRPWYRKSWEPETGGSNILTKFIKGSLGGFPPPHVWWGRTCPTIMSACPGSLWHGCNQSFRQLGVLCTQIHSSNDQEGDPELMIFREEISLTIGTPVATSPVCTHSDVENGVTGRLLYQRIHVLPWTSSGHYVSKSRRTGGADPIVLPFPNAAITPQSTCSTWSPRARAVGVLRWTGSMDLSSFVRGVSEQTVMAHYQEKEDALLPLMSPPWKRNKQPNWKNWKLQISIVKAVHQHSSKATTYPLKRELRTTPALCFRGIFWEKFLFLKSQTYCWGRWPCTVVWNYFHTWSWNFGHIMKRKTAWTGESRKPHLIYLRVQILPRGLVHLRSLEEISLGGCDFTHTHTHTQSRSAQILQDSALPLTLYPTKLPAPAGLP